MWPFRHYILRGILPNCIFTNCIFKTVFSRLYNSKLYFSKLYFQNCIIPNCIFKVEASYKLCEFIYSHNMRIWTRHALLKSRKVRNIFHICIPRLGPLHLQLAQTAANMKIWTLVTLKCWEHLFLKCFLLGFLLKLKFGRNMDVGHLQIPLTYFWISSNDFEKSQQQQDKTTNATPSLGCKTTERLGPPRALPRPQMSPMWAHAKPNRGPVDSVCAHSLCLLLHPGE